MLTAEELAAANRRPDIHCAEKTRALHDPGRKGISDFRKIEIFQTYLGDMCGYSTSRRDRAELVIWAGIKADLRRFGFSL